MRQRVFVIVMPLVGLVGGVALQIAEPSVAVGFVLMIFALVLLGRWLPRLRAWVGSGVQLYTGVFGVFMGVSGQLETPVIRALSLILGVSFLMHLLIRGFLRELGMRKARHTAT